MEESSPKLESRLPPGLPNSGAPEENPGVVVGVVGNPLADDAAAPLGVAGVEYPPPPPPTTPEAFLEEKEIAVDAADAPPLDAGPAEAVVVVEAALFL